MNTNEKIARWAGWKKRDATEKPPSEWVDADFVVGNIAYWDKPPPYDVELAFWHGEDGLLAEIESRSQELDFLFQLQVLLRVVPKGGTSGGDLALLYWVIRRAEAPQLAAALVKVIEGSVS